MKFTDSSGKEHLLEFKYDNYFKEISLYLTVEYDSDPRPPHNIKNHISVIELSKIRSKSEKWESYNKELRLPKDLKKYIEKLTTDKYLQLL